MEHTESARVRGERNPQLRRPAWPRRGEDAAIRVPHVVGHVLGRLQQQAPTIANLHRSMGTAGSMVALTFDDGPDPTFTPRVLDILGELGVPATFFVVGANAATHKTLV